MMKQDTGSEQSLAVCQEINDSFIFGQINLNELT